MPRTKESDDESDIKTGRRSKAITGINVDSPLRRSTRNRQQINRDLSPDGVNITSGPVTRTTRRKAASQEVSTSEFTRTLRSRKTSFTSDTSENHDLDIIDTKRTTRKSTTATTSDTPTSIRLRRSARAGSESKTIQSPTKTSRFTRASSLDLEERDNEVQRNLQEAHNSTPIKLRRRASILPSEPALIEEIEKDHNSLQESLQSIIENDQQEKEINDTENRNNTVYDLIKHTDLTKSPVLRLSRGFTPEIEIDTDESNENTNDISTNTLKSTIGCSLKSILKGMNDSQLKEESIISDKGSSQIHEINQTPKVVVEKMKFPFNDRTSQSLDINPNNKENEKSNVTIPIKKLTFPSSEETLIKRKSLIPTASEKISIAKRLNKTVDDKISTTNENLSNEFSLTSQKPFENFSGIEMINQNVFSVNAGPKDQSIIIMEQSEELDYNDKNSENTSIQQKQSSENISLNFSINDHLKVYEENDGIEKPIAQNNEISMMVIDEEQTNSPKDKTQISNEASNVTLSPIGLEETRKEYELSSLIIEEVNLIVDGSENDESQENIIMENNSEDKLSTNKAISPFKGVEENDKESNQSIEDESDYDFSHLFKDIPADEWNEKPIQSSKNVNFVEENLNNNIEKQESIADDEKKKRNFENESIKDFELVLVDKKAWEAAEADRLKEMKRNNSLISADTIQINTFRKSIDPPASPSCEELIDIDENETETGMKLVQEKVKNTPNNSFLEQSSTNKQSLNESNDNTPASNKLNIPETEMKLKQITPIGIDSIKNSQKLLVKDNHLHRKSLDSLLSTNETSKTTFLKTRKSLNPSIKLDATIAEIHTGDEIKSSIKSLEISNDKSLNISESEDIHKMDTEESIENKKEETTIIPKDILSQITSDSDMQSIDSENEINDPTITLPAFLYGESSDSSNQQENDSSSTDSDIAREYNLNGDDIVEYSDDNVSGDICHASETESTESDEEDDDMADFIVDDDEEIDEEMEDEESESEKDKSDSDNEEEEIIHGYEARKPTISQENTCESKNQILKTIKPSIDKLNTPQLVKSTKTDKLLLKKSKVNLDNSFSIDDSSTASKLPETFSFNKTMLLPCTNSPETQLLLKEKLNDTLPALKLKQTNKKRKSSLCFIKENYGNDKSDGICVNKEPIDETKEDKIRQKKQKKTTNCIQDGFNIENISTQIHERSQLSELYNKNVEKKKKKALKENSSLNLNSSPEKKNEKKEKKQQSKEAKKSKEKLISMRETDRISTEANKNNSNKSNILKRVRRLSSENYYTAEEIDIECVQNSKRSPKSNKLKNSLPKFMNSELEESSSVQSILKTRNKVKRLPDDVIEGLFDVPVPPKKKRRLLVDQKVLPSRKMFDSEHPKPDNISIEDEGSIPLSSSGGTTSFYVMNLEKPKKSKKLAAVYSFRERMLKRNQRQPISAYLMYQQKLKALKNNKY